jgi:hypothetical protein
MESKMAHTIVHHFPGGTKEQYEASIAAVHPGRTTLPKGQILHAAGPYAGGWSIVAVHDSKQSRERFHDGILMPRMKRGIKGGFAAPPQEMGFEVDITAVHQRREGEAASRSGSAASRRSEVRNRPLDPARTRRSSAQAREPMVSAVGWRVEFQRH